VQEVEHTHGIPVASIVTLDELVAYLAERPDQRYLLESLHAYRREFGIA
jgi:orotate phosphoribosyltransferase